MPNSKPVTEMPKTTLIVTPRERFGMAVDALKSIIADTDSPYELIYIDGSSPTPVARMLEALCRRHGFKYMRFDRYLSPNEARNIGQREATTDYVVFIDNDVIVSPGWLSALETCAEETGAEVIAPLTCQRDPLHHEIHQAGGEFTDDMSGFFQGPASDRRITDIHLLQGKKTVDVELTRGETQCCEFHCAMVRRDVFEQYGELDEDLMATKEHIDFCMNIWAQGGKVMFEPASVVTYLFPNRERPMTMSDWPYFALRWSPRWQQASLNKFKAKWALDSDPYFEKRKDMLDWRLKEGIVKPMLRKAPVVGRSHKWQAFGTSVLLPVVRAWSDRLVDRHARQRRTDA